MLLTITTTHRPATDLGYLLHKHPDKAQAFEVAGGVAHVFYPQADAARCTAALHLEIDPIGLVRGPAASVAHYVNDRPYAAGSHMSVAIGRVFASALKGAGGSRQALVDTPLPLEIRIVPVRCRGGEAQARGLFAPMGWTVGAGTVPLEETRPDWGDAPYLDLTLSGTVRLAEALAQLAVLLPVMDGDVHYWVDEGEVDKLERRGKGWLETHPMRELILSRTLRKARGLIDDARARFEATDETGEETGDTVETEVNPEVEARIPLNRQRMDAVLEALLASGARSVADLGCGSGVLLERLIASGRFERMTGLDVSQRSLDIAARRLHLDRMVPALRERVTLLQGGLTYRDDRLKGHEAAAVVEVVEHVEPERLGAFEQAVFGHPGFGTVVLTTPNRDYNVVWDGVGTSRLRHGDHRFEWTRDEFEAWVADVCGRFGYDAGIHGIGVEMPGVGRPTQMAVFTKRTLVRQEA